MSYLDIGISVEHFSFMLWLLSVLILINFLIQNI